VCHDADVPVVRAPRRLARCAAVVLALVLGALLPSVRGDQAVEASPVLELVPAKAAAPRLAAVRGRRINIDPGHNGGNTGAFNNQIPPETRQLIRNGVRLASPQCDTSGTATYGGYSEHAYNFDVALRLKRILERAGAKVTLTRTSDSSQGPCTSQRAAIGNRADVAISIHADGGDAGRGFHVIYPTSRRGYTDDIARPSYRLAVAIRDAMRTTGMPDSTYVGRKGLNGRQDLVGLLLSDVPKVFLESGAMHNPTDARLLGTASFRQRIAQALAGGLDEYLAAAH
jgi:N-acetylmuramoyl-L-alanine amidase